MGNLFQRCYTIEGRHDFATGLLYHAWNESRKQRWSHPETGQSKHFWSCATGWYLMGIVAVLDFLPENHPDRESLIEIRRPGRGSARWFAYFGDYEWALQSQEVNNYPIGYKVSQQIEN